MTVFSIAPHARFIPTLVERVLDGTLLGGAERSGPFWLSDVTIIVPTRRARLAMADEFARRGHGLLPDIRTLGGQPEDEEPFLPPFNVEPPLPPASPLERRLVLSSLVAAWADTPDGRQAFSTPPTAAEILSMSESLGELIDDLATEERQAADIRAIVPEMGGELGAYWQQTLTFLDIALHYWPQRLADRGLADSTSLRGQRLGRQAAAAPFLWRDRPVIAAGSTGSIPATARLLKAIHTLPRGAVVLPGLDCSMEDADLIGLRDQTKNPHGHPQYGLAHLLAELGTDMASVQELAQTDSWRSVLVHRAMALTDNTAQWPGQRLTAEQMEQASDGLVVIAGRTEDEEARAIALAARAALAEQRSVGIVTPDRNLARRIAAELKRFEIVVDDAAGTPLFQSPAGRLVRQIVAVCEKQFGPVDLMALLRNRAALFGLTRGEIDRLADDIELGLLRGQRGNPGLGGLRALLDDNASEKTERVARRLGPERAAAVGDFLSTLETALAPLTALGGETRIRAAQLAAAILQAFDAVSAGNDVPGKAELSAWAGQMAGLAGEGLSFAPRGLETVLAALMTGFQVRTREERRSDIAIWGQLEARLMNPDLLVLAGLNEDVWPEAADPGPWLSRGMRLKAGLEPPERRQGLAAHDFVQGMGNQQVIIAYADRIGSSPALPSRLVQRLEAFAGGAAARGWEAKGMQWIEQARQIDAVAEVSPATRPLPNPDVAHRPKGISITEVETLMRSPYDLHAKYVLKLRPLDPLGMDPDARERGTIIHAIFADFVEAGHDVMADDALDKMNAIARTRFAGLDAIGERRDIWLRRFETAARQFLDFERERNGNVSRRHAEINGEWPLRLSEEFRLRGRADRIDELTDGTLEILDFKTGSPPSKGAMQAFEVPQLLLEAQMAQAGALEGVPASPSSALTYIKVGLGPDAFQPKPFVAADGHDIMSAADEISRRMQAHIEHFLLRETPLPARLLPLPGQRFAGAYDHLARVAEWSAGEDEEGGA